MPSQVTSDATTILRDLFGDNRAEWPPDRFGELFVEPAYFRKLEALRPSLLEGGRGTGKTTALRSLRFDATAERLNAQGGSFSDQEHLGIFVRINKNRVHAFQGAALEVGAWSRAFAHYFNLVACLEMVRLAQWLQLQQRLELSRPSIAQIAADLAVDASDSLSDLGAAIRDGISRLQLYVNNVPALDQPVLSLSESPLRTFADVLAHDGLLESRTIFCCIDEYENLLPTQQAVLNTYVKHAEPPLSYKVGVRKNGLKTHHTLDGKDVLEVPNDYRRIKIEDEGFEHFAKAVADVRLRRARSLGAAAPARIEELLPSLGLAEESRRLGAEAVADGVQSELAAADPELARWFAGLPKTDGYFLRYWAESEQKPIDELARSWREDDAPWRTRLNNYRYASLFWLSVGRKGARIRKYYCGLKTVLTLAHGNIRYFLELIDEAIAEHFSRHGPPSDSDNELALDPVAQTQAAREVGLRRLDQVEGLAEHGVELKRLVLAIGKVFFELARAPLGRTPEVTQFVLSGNPASVQKIRKLLDEGVAYLAFDVAPRTKATTAVEMRDDEYRLHPIFCAFFEISHRRKRRTTFDADHLLQVLQKPSKAISSMLEGAEQTAETELPDQLAFFSTFFGGGSEAG